MAKKVLKFGGTSVGSIDRIEHAANIVKREQLNGDKIIVIVSAMTGKTNEIIKHSQFISKEFDKREFRVVNIVISSLSYLFIEKSLRNKN